LTSIQCRISFREVSTLTAHSVELLLKRNFFYESSMMGNDYMPYRVPQGHVIALDQPTIFGPRTSLTEMPISWSLVDRQETPHRITG
jgi:peptidoglycan-N-acetylglucosamine deacetylase